MAFTHLINRPARERTPIRARQLTVSGEGGGGAGCRGGVWRGWGVALHIISDEKSLRAWSLNREGKYSVPALLLWHQSDGAYRGMMYGVGLT